MAQKVLRFTKREGGEWIKPAGKGITDEEVFSLPLINHQQKGWLWGYIHSFVRKDGRRFDAYNDGYLKCKA